MIEVFLKLYLLYWLKDKGVEILSEIKYKEVNKEGLVVATKDGNERLLKADTIVTAIPMKPDTELIDNMQGKANEVYVIGDAKEPHLIFDTMVDGARIAREI